MKNFMRSLGLGSNRSSRSSHSNRSDQQDDAQGENVADAAGSTSHSDSGSPFNSLPRRPRKKATDLTNALNSSNYIPHELQIYAEAALQAAKTGSSEAITSLDSTNKYCLANAYNSRFSGLHLSCHDSAQAFFSEFMTTDKPAWRSVVRLLIRPGFPRHLKAMENG